jgi:hypothetical protein
MMHVPMFFAVLLVLAVVSGLGFFFFQFRLESASRNRNDVKEPVPVVSPQADRTLVPVVSLQADRTLVPVVSPQVGNQNDSVASHDSVGRVLLFFSSYPSEDHFFFLDMIWPKILSRSDFLSNADILVYVGGTLKGGVRVDQWTRVVQNLPSFRSKRLIHEDENPGFQQGAMKVVSSALHKGW